MKCRFTMRRNRCGYFLYCEGELIAESRNPIDLFSLVLSINLVKGGSLA